MSDRLVVHALALARKGWPVLPCHHPDRGGCSCAKSACASPAKHPRTRSGLYDASANPRQVARWWRRWPDANVGVRTGAPPDGAGLVVVDIDPAHGGEVSLRILVDHHGPTPPTLEAATGGGGRHLYFAHPGGHVPNSAGRLGRGLDVRGDGGYVLVPPSRHSAGTRYEWRVRPDVAALPLWLHRLALASAPESDGPCLRGAAVNEPGRWAGAALRGELARVRAAAEGTRNDTLNRAAFSLGQLVAAGHLDGAHVARALIEAGLAVGLGRRETRATVASGLRAGERWPRHPSVA